MFWKKKERKVVMGPQGPIGFTGPMGPKGDSPTKAELKKLIREVLKEEGKI